MEIEEENHKSASDLHLAKDKSSTIQSELNDLVSDLTLSKESSKILASNEQNLLILDTKLTFQGTREKHLLSYFFFRENLVYCNNVEGLIKKTFY